MTQRGRPRKHQWLSFKDLSSKFSAEAQYLKWASSNNSSLQKVAATGCPRCNQWDFELRRDKKFKVIRFHCTKCHHETSYRIKMPKPGSFQIVPILHNGIQIGESIVDHYHPVTRRQRSDAFVLKFHREVENGKVSLGGEWYVDGLGGALNQKRYYLGFGEVLQLCRWNKIQTEHEKRLHQLENEIVV